MEPEYYTYEEEEQTAPNTSNRNLFVGLFLGLIIGSVIGYVMGSQNAPLPDVTGLFSSPSLIILVNIILVLFILVFVVIKRSGFQTQYKMGGYRATRMRVVILMLVLGLIMAGFFAFYIFERVPQ